MNTTSPHSELFERPPRDMEEAQRLLEDLRVHQAELHLQAQALQETQRQATQQAQRYAHLLRAVPVALCRINERGQIVSANQAMERLLHRPSSALEGQLLYRFGLDESQRLHALQAVQLSTTRETHEARHLWFSADGEPVLLDLHFSRAPDAEDTRTEWLVALLDQTRQHREHHALQKAHEALQKANATNQELALLADRSPNAVMICDSEMHIRWVNPSFTQSTGYSLQEARGHHPQQLLGADDTPSETLTLMTQRLQRGDAVDRVQLQRCAKDGTRYWAEVSVQPIRNDDGLIARHIVIERDITDRVQAEREREALMRIEASHVAKTEFLSRMSHNMRTPLNAVLGFAHLLLKGPEPLPNESQRKKVQIIHQAGQQLLGLVDQALQLAKLEHALEDYAPEPINLLPLLQECAELVNERARDKALVLEIDSPAMCAMGDAQRVREIVNNLLSNAIKYSHGPGRIVLSSRIDTARHLVEVSVKDQGVGIAASHLDLIFQPFTRLDATSEMASGHGIGLAICRRLAELMMGDLNVTSTPGEGSTFTLTLPAADSMLPRAMRDLVAEDDALEPLPPLRLLCVEDNTMNRLLIDAVFATHPEVQVAMATTLGEGMACVRTTPPDVVLLDINLPDGNGLTLARSVSEQPGGTRPLIIALSADALPENIAQAMDAGVTHYLVKPLQINRLLRILHEHFRV